MIHLWVLQLCNFYCFVFFQCVALKENWPCTVKEQTPSSMKDYTPPVVNWWRLQVDTSTWDMQSGGFFCCCCFFWWGRVCVTKFVITKNTMLVFSSALDDPINNRSMRAMASVHWFWPTRIWTNTTWRIGDSATMKPAPPWKVERRG